MSLFHSPTKRLLCVIAALSLLPFSLGAQVLSSRAFIRSQIKHYGECRSIAFTKNGASLMIYGKNGFATNSCPKVLVSTLESVNSQDFSIDDVQLSESGGWLVLYNKLSCSWEKVPSDLESTIRNTYAANKPLRLAAFNDAGEWVAMDVDSKIYTSSQELRDWIDEGLRMMGALRYVCISEDAKIAIFESGYRAVGELPEPLRKALNEADFKVGCVKTAGDSWFISDGIKKYECNF
ncbi:MAG: hypothetical protein IJU69_04685 [Bacteroidales bacterium]|nr:hypothetical protein [Bacteroidales bacterium]